MRSRLRFTLLALALAACNSAGSIVEVRVEAAPAISGIAGVHVTVAALGTTRDFDPPVSTPLSTPFTFPIDLPSNASGPISLRVTLTSANGTQLGAGDGSGIIKPGDTSTVTVNIGGAPPDLGSDSAIDMAPDLAPSYTWVAKDAGYPSGSAPIFTGVAGSGASVFALGFTLSTGVTGLVTHSDGTKFTPQTISDSLVTGRIWVSPSGTTAFAAAGGSGSMGALLETVNGGTTWTGATLPSWASSNGLSGVWASSDAMTAYVCGANGTISKSTDGGATWSARQTTNTTKGLLDVWGSSASNVYAVGDSSTILHTIDGGINWQTQTPPPALVSNPVHLRGVYGVSPTEIYAVGDAGTIIQTDGSGTWTLSVTGFSNQQLNGVWGTGNDVYVVGLNGLILHSKNHGQTWVPEVSNTAVQLNAVWGSSATDVYVVGGHVIAACPCSVILHRE